MSADKTTRRGIVPGNRSLHDFIMREAAACSRMKPRDARDAQPVECSICEWKGRRVVARSRPCPSCGSKVDFR